MLTSLQHQFAPRFGDPDKRQAYTTHMCGLCHALGDRYGLLSRLLTNHEMILLNLLTDAQRQEAPSPVKRRCPLNPYLKVTTHQNTASEFAAAVAVELASAKFADDIQDSGGRDVTARLGHWLTHKPRQIAAGVLAGLGFEAGILTRLNALQMLAEEDEYRNASQPSAVTSAKLFAMTARLAGTLENEKPLAIIGANFGAYIYLLDAYRDFADDMAEGNYNPLRRFSETSPGAVALSQAGLEWLLGRFERIQIAIQRHVPGLKLYRYHTLITELLSEPANKTAFELRQCLQRRRRLVFRQWRLADILKAGLFILPIAMVGVAVIDSGDEESKPKADQEREKKRGNVCDNCASDPCYHFHLVDCYHCDLDSLSKSCQTATADVSKTCERVDCGPIHHGSVDCSSLNPSGICEQVDCSNLDCSGANCSGADCSGLDCGGLDCCSGLDCSGCN